MLILSGLCLQTVCDVMLRSWSRRTLGETYSSSSVLMVAELVKLTASLVAGGVHPCHLLVLLRKSTPAAVPAVAFLVMNMLQFDAVARLDASTFTVGLQTKTLWSAIFSMWLLGRKTSLRKWRALLVLVAGVALIVHQSGYDLQLFASVDGFVVGLAELALQTALGGFTSVYIEKYLKGSAASLSIWEVNVQMAVWSAVGYAFLASFPRPAATFDDWSLTTCGIVATSATGGILVASCLKYTDAVLKNFPTSVSVVLVTYGSAIFLNGPATFPTAVGSLLVAISVFNYAEPEAIGGAVGIKRQNSAPGSVASLTVRRTPSQQNLVGGC
ncbi:hypothetical protein EMIHUDRAFT_62094 [Emiliania huxleyi CCMP1516]|uniref:Sugar phosphate transporter domain-containing protein n=2 Tax=Emiliania huxleyi TaxID=2903 RepID=A0A0D3IE62_EMIH1|nr:hypothetical protein EMIHUDRAFT_62094 [Emiliania huxleyi CCMP1516]EOD09547.1 hypothetical protein EMIHUDRAFT_62094 [Emiliania huxleyi CCMP1516]|eukprot:XP_005761976.1 hypothetical protein EMIHUDRAFT_62094 [Emiliania huxleyi CCMP1516]